jgi:ParB family chromosome partitioning protein
MSSKQNIGRGLGKGLGDMPDFNDINSNRKSKITEIIRDIDKSELDNKDIERKELKTQILSGNGPASKEFAENRANKNPRVIGQMAGKIAMIPIGNIERNSNQPRKSFESSSLKKLENSIRELGIIQPITVRKISALKYQIISGERRFRAGQAAGLEEIPSYIRKANDIQLLEMALVENVQRQDLHPLEIATSYKRLIDECRLTHEQISLLVGKARASITNSIRLLELPEEIKIELAKRTLSQGHAKALLSISNNPERQILIMNLAITQKFSVRQTENLCKKDGGKKKLLKSTSVKRTISPDEEQALSILKIKFGNATKIKTTLGSAGQIELRYKDSYELQELLDKLTQ